MALTMESACPPGAWVGRAGYGPLILSMRMTRMVRLRAFELAFRVGLRDKLIRANTAMAAVAQPVAP